MAGKRKRDAAPARKGSKDDAHEIKSRLLTRKNPSVAKGISQAAVLKDGDLFLLTESDGSLPSVENHGFGLYLHDCRFLDGYEIRVNGKSMQSLAASTSKGYESTIELANPGLPQKGEEMIPEHALGIRWTHSLSGRDQSLFDTVEAKNYGKTRIDMEIAFSFRAGFDDVFHIRGLYEKRTGKTHRPGWKGGSLVFSHAGADGMRRAVSIRFSSAPDERKGTSAVFRMALRSGQVKALRIAIVLEEERGDKKKGSRGNGRIFTEAAPAGKTKAGPAGRAASRNAEERERNYSRFTRFDSDSVLLSRILDRSLRDLQSLESELDGGSYYAAGLPWFGTLFGRDAIVTCLQTLAYDPSTAQSTLRLLARYQGKRLDAWTEEEPGRILHEYRSGELARAGLVPYTPYYGTVDATALFLILLARHAAWSGSLDLFRELRAQVDLAFDWMDTSGDRNGDGFLEYSTQLKGRQVNQGWKDAGDAIINKDGSLAKSPISLVEVQGYVYLARQGMADLMRRNGEDGAAERQESLAEALRIRFQRDFWPAGQGFPALALQDGGKPVDVVSSNPGQALWSGILPQDRAEAVKDRLMEDDMFSGWGVRTFSSRETGYNPVGYHLGTVWPHDNAIIASGFRRYGFDAEAKRIFEGIFAAAGHFHEGRLPELFCGFPRSVFPEPVSYPIACHPQAWAAGSMPFLMETLLGLEPDGFAGRLRIVRPMLPDACDWVELKGVRVGAGQADLRFERSGSGVKVEVLRRDGLEIVAGMDF